MPLTDAQLSSYFDDGFVIVEGLLTPAELQPAIDEISGRVDDLATRLREAGLIDDTFAGLGFFERLAALERAYPGAAVLIHVNGSFGTGMAALWGSPKLLDIVAQMIGPNIAGHPVCNVRSKTPETELMTVPWHQDTAYLLAGAEATLQPAAWIPFLDATVATGCMQVRRGAHKAGLFKHHLEREVGNPKSWYLYIAEADLAPFEVVTCEVPLGGVLFINQLIPHRSLENHSDVVRWSVDLRWQRPEEPAGWEGIIELLEMRRADDPDFGPDWEVYFSQRAKAFESFRTPGKGDLDVTVDGPWIERWR